VAESCTLDVTNNDTTVAITSGVIQSDVRVSLENQAVDSDAFKPLHSSDLPAIR
jgi:hypothetical protein